MNIKKILLLFFFFVQFAYSGDEFEGIGEQINAFWVARNYSGIKGVFNSRLEENPNDFFGNCLKSQYYFYVNLDFEKSRNAIDKLLEVTLQTQNEVLIRWVQELKNDIYSVPLEESIPLTADELNKIHSLFLFKNSFPGIETCIKLSQKFNVSK